MWLAKSVVKISESVKSARQMPPAGALASLQQERLNEQPLAPSEVAEFGNFY